MKRSHVYGICVAVMAVFLGFLLVQHIRNHARNRQIAMTLLEVHHQWAINDYHPAKTPLPSLLTKQGDVNASAAGILGAYVQYDFRKDGIEWTKRYHILRADTNTTTWVLYEFAEPKDTNLVRMAWKHKLITVTGEP